MLCLRYLALQIAQAAEAGGDGVYLIHSVAGGALEELLFAACTVGIEALVEVHGADEARRAVNAGATLLIVRLNGGPPIGPCPQLYSVSAPTLNCFFLAS